MLLEVLRNKLEQVADYTDQVDQPASALCNDIPDLRGVESVQSPVSSFVDTSSPTLPRRCPCPLMNDDRGERWRKRGEALGEGFFAFGGIDGPSRKRQESHRR